MLSVPFGWTGGGSAHRNVRVKTSFSNQRPSARLDVMPSTIMDPIKRILAPRINYIFARVARQ